MIVQSWVRGDRAALDEALADAVAAWLVADGHGVSWILVVAVDKVSQSARVPVGGLDCTHAHAALTVYT